MKQMRCVFVTALLSLALGAPASHASEAAMAKLLDCLKLKPASPEQQACTREVETLRAAPPAAAAQKPATEPRKTPVKVQVASAPDDVRKAVQALKLGNIQDMDTEAALRTVQVERAKVLDARVKEHLLQMQRRNEEVSRTNTLIAKLNAQRPASTEKGVVAKFDKLRPDEIVLLGLRAPGSTIAFTQVEIDLQTRRLKSTIDNQGTRQQAEIARLKALNNNSNEAFELVSAFIKNTAAGGRA